jgi:hypothetical protein
MPDTSRLEAEQERTRRIDLPLYDQELQSALAAYRRELETEQARQDGDRPKPRRIRI